MNLQDFIEKAEEELMPEIWQRLESTKIEPQYRDLNTATLADKLDLLAKSLGKIAAREAREGNTSYDVMILELRELAAYLYEKRLGNTLFAAYSHDRAGKAARYCSEPLSKAFHRLKASQLFHQIGEYTDSAYSLLYGIEALLEIQPSDLERLGITLEQAKNIGLSAFNAIKSHPDYRKILEETKFDKLKQLYK